MDEFNLKFPIPYIPCVQTKPESTLESLKDNIKTLESFQSTKPVLKNKTLASEISEISKLSKICEIKTSLNKKMKDESVFELLNKAMIMLKSLKTPQNVPNEKPTVVTCFIGDTHVVEDELEQNSEMVDVEVECMDNEHEVVLVESMCPLDVGEADSRMVNVEIECVEQEQEELSDESDSIIVAKPKSFQFCQFLTQVNIGVEYGLCSDECGSKKGKEEVVSVFYLQQKTTTPQATVAEYFGSQKKLAMGLTCALATPHFHSYMLMKLQVRFMHMCEVSYLFSKENVRLCEEKCILKCNLSLGGCLMLIDEFCVEFMVFKFLKSGYKICVAETPTQNLQGALCQTNFSRKATQNHKYNNTSFNSKKCFVFFSFGEVLKAMLMVISGCKSYQGYIEDDELKEKHETIIVGLPFASVITHLIMDRFFMLKADEGILNPRDLLSIGEELMPLMWECLKMSHMRFVVLWVVKSDYDVFTIETKSQNLQGKICQAEHKLLFLCDGSSNGMLISIFDPGKLGVQSKSRIPQMAARTRSPKKPTLTFDPGIEIRNVLQMAGLELRSGEVGCEHGMLCDEVGMGVSSMNEPFDLRTNPFQVEEFAAGAKTRGLQQSHKKNREKQKSEKSYKFMIFFVTWPVQELFSPSKCELKWRANVPLETLHCRLQNPPTQAWLILNEEEDTTMIPGLARIHTEKHFSFSNQTWRRSNSYISSMRPLEMLELGAIAKLRQLPSKWVPMGHVIPHNQRAMASANRHKLLKFCSYQNVVSVREIA